MRFYDVNSLVVLGAIFMLGGALVVAQGAGRFYEVERNGQVVVVDRATTLEWQPDILTGLNWHDALRECEKSTHAGLSDWRLPNIKELRSLVDYHKGDAPPATAFPGMTADNDERFWSSSARVYNAVYAWRVDFDHGYVHYSNEANTYSARCVRSGP